MSATAIGTDEAGVPTAQTLPALLGELADADPDHEAVVAGESRLTFGQLRDAAEQVGSALSGLGVGRGDVVALLATNTAEWLISAFGVLACGARLDAFNTWAKAYDLRYLLSTSRASVLITTPTVRSTDMLAQLREVVPEVWDAGVQEWRSDEFPALREVVVLGDEPPRGARSWADFVSPDPAERPGQVSPAGADEPACVVYTSGSTKNPKAVPLCHRDLVVNGFHIGSRMGLTSSDRVWLSSPLFWSFGIANAVMATFTHGACLVLQEQFEPAAAVELMQREAVTAAYLLPSMADAFVHSAAELETVSSLRTGLTLGRADEVRRVAIDLGVAEICNVYGSTETYGNCCVTAHDAPLEDRVSSQGRPLPGVEVRVVDDRTGEDLPIGEAGELYVRGRLTPGYLDDDEANADAFTEDGWYRTGDRMTVRPDGAVVFNARMTEMIKTSGINVSPAEVESFLSSLPEIREVTVVGAPHPAKDEVVVAFVVPASDGLTGEQVIERARNEIAGYKVPWVVSIVDSIPQTNTGKIVRRDLAQTAADLVEARLSAGEA